MIPSIPCETRKLSAQIAKNGIYIAKKGTNIAKKGNFGGVTAEDARYPVIPSIPCGILCDIPSLHAEFGIRELTQRARYANNSRIYFADGRKSDEFV